MASGDYRAAVTELHRLSHFEQPNRNLCSLANLTLLESPVSVSRNKHPGPKVDRIPSQLRHDYKSVSPASGVSFRLLWFASGLTLSIGVAMLLFAPAETEPANVAHSLSLSVPEQIAGGGGIAHRQS